MAMTRRKLIAVLASWAGCGLLGALQAPCRLTTFRAAEPTGRSLTGFLVRRQSARRVGLEYLRLAPWEANRDVLIGLLCQGRTARSSVHTRKNSEVIRKLVLSQQREDFTRGRIVQLHGWVLSQTEARLCALVALG